MSFFPYDLTKSAGSRLRGKLTSLEAAVADAARELATMTAMLTGNPAQDASYNTIVMQYGFVDAASAHAAYDIISAGVARLTTDAQIDTVASSLATMFNSLRE